MPPGLERMVGGEDENDEFEFNDEDDFDAEDDDAMGDDQLGLFGGYSADVSAISVYYWPLDVSYTLYT